MELIIFCLLSYLFGGLTINALLKKIKLLTNIKLINLDFKFILRRANLLSYGLIIIFEVLQGLIITKLASKFSFNPLEIGLIILSLFIGHHFSWLRRDKNYYTHGTAIILGAFFSLSIELFMLVIILWLIIFIILGYRTLATLLVILFLPVYVWFFYTQYTLTASILASILIIFSAREVTEIIKDVQKPDIYGVLQRIINYDDDIV